MAPIEKAVLGSIAFGIFWVLVVFPAVPFLPIGRTAGSLLGAVLMVVFQVITPEQAFSAIDLPILGLLFGTMAVGGYLESADLFKYLGKLLSWRSQGGKDLICRVCFISAVSSALFTNDTACVVLTEFVLKIAKQNNLPPRIFLLALASSANIGSSATPIGNPQNLVIAIQGKISFGEFLIGILPSMIVGIVVNAVILLCYFWAFYSREKVEERETAAEDEAASDRFSPSTMSHVSSEDSPRRSLEIDETSPVNADSTAVDVESGRNLERESFFGRRKRLLWKICVYLVTLGMLVSLLAGLNMSWTAITAALALVVLDFRDARPCLDKVSYSLLIFFCGMFMTVDGFNKTGIPGELWDLMEPYARIDRTSGVVVLALAVTALSNLASNVPTVLLLGVRVAASASAISPTEVTRAWLILAWVSTVAGNLSLFGSAANLIVCEQARQSPSFSSDLPFWTHLRFGLPSTLIVTSAGLLLLRDR